MTEIRPSPVEPPELTRLYGDRYAPMVRLAHLITGSSAVAPDLVQDAFLKVAPRLAHLESPPAYLRTVVVNECRGWLRRQAVERRHQRPPEPVLVIPPDVDEVWSALDRLTDRQRAAIVLRFYEDLSFDDIARVLDCRLGTASPWFIAVSPSSRRSSTDEPFRSPRRGLAARRAAHRR